LITSSEPRREFLPGTSTSQESQRDGAYPQIHRIHTYRSNLNVNAISTAPSMLYDTVQQQQQSVARELPKDMSVRFGFSAGGLLFPFYIGVVKGLEKAGYMSERTRIAGASAGSLIAACVNSGLSMDTVATRCEDLMEDCRKHGTRGRLGIVLEKFLQDSLPDDAHIRCSGKTHVAVSSISPITPVLVSEFESRDDLIEALMTSCHVPLWMDGRLTTEFRGVTHLDGGVTNFIPLPPGDEPAVRVSCFGAKQLSAVYDIGIAPDVFEEWPHSLTTMVQWAFSPAEHHFQRMLIDRGECDALSWASAFDAESPTAADNITHGNGE
jgi:predicted acylesterase/phospholipase RssA